MEFINWVTSFDWSGFVTIALQACGLASLIASQTPNKSDDQIIDAILKFVNFLGGNFSKAANKP